MLSFIHKFWKLLLVILRHFWNGFYGKRLFDNEIDQRDFLTKMLQKSSLEALKILNIELVIKDSKKLINKSSNNLIVSNHLSYVDVMIISAIKQSAFVTSKEVEQSPFLGDVCRMAGTYFVERRNTYGLRQQLNEITSALKSGMNVALFPEATSTDGSHIRPFKRGLLAAAKNAGVNVLPLCLNYTHVNEEPIDRLSRDSVFYYGEMSFFPHLIRLLRAKSVRVELEVLDEIPHSYTNERVEITEVLYERLQSVFVPVS